MSRTAKEFLESKGIYNDKSIRLQNMGMTTDEAMQEFAKMHVTEALDRACNQMQIPEQDREFITDCYPLTNIK